MRISDWSSDVCSSDLVAASWLLGRVASPRLQVQMVLIVAGALLVAWLPLHHGRWNDAPAPVTVIDPAFAVLWIVGGVCALGTAFQAQSAGRRVGAGGVSQCRSRWSPYH